MASNAPGGAEEVDRRLGDVSDRLQAYAFSGDAGDPGGATTPPPKRDGSLALTALQDASGGDLSLRRTPSEPAGDAEGGFMFTEASARRIMSDPRYSDLVHSFALRRQQRQVNDLLGVSIGLLFLLTVIEEEIRSNWMLLAMSLLVVAQVGCLYRFYNMELRRQKIRDPLWRCLTLWNSPLLGLFLVEVFIHLLHCPPFLPDLWEEAHLFNILVWGRVYVFLRLFRDRAFGAKGSRIVASLSQTNLDLPFIIKTTLYKDPFPLSLGSLAAVFAIMSFQMYAAEKEAGMRFEDAVWLTGVTFTTVGYGNIVPATRIGRIIALFSAVIGIVFTALITAIIHRSLTISKTQKQMVLFMMECGQAMNVKIYASRVITQACRVRNLGGPSAPQSQWRKLNFLCVRFRALRRREGMLEIDILEMLLADPRHVLSQNTLLQQLCQSSADAGDDFEEEGQEEDGAGAPAAAAAGAAPPAAALGVGEPVSGTNSATSSFSKLVPISPSPAPSGAKQGRHRASNAGSEISEGQGRGRSAAGNASPARGSIVHRGSIAQRGSMAQRGSIAHRGSVVSPPGGRGFFAGLSAVLGGHTRVRPTVPVGQVLGNYDEGAGRRRSSAGSCRSNSSNRSTSSRARTRSRRIPAASGPIAGARTSPSAAGPAESPRGGPHQGEGLAADTAEVARLADRVTNLEASLSQMGVKMDGIEAALGTILRELRDPEIPAAEMHEA
eukprot:TRINITY_DN24822_c0_g1_i1.p1 TRINITY_DN24822_c0_g1~~TRINITY_DN24822_c0_g1_i1.p1  ORF type:complete len:722 (+),score=198.14 TRINITY_DN24822_c0_g1_i1:83-2248(+)